MSVALNWGDPYASRSKIVFRADFFKITNSRFGGPYLVGRTREKTGGRKKALKTILDSFVHLGRVASGKSAGQRVSPSFQDQTFPTFFEKSFLQK